MNTITQNFRRMEINIYDRCKIMINLKHNDIAYFYFECKKCGERWFSTFNYCPKCKGNEKFKILSSELAEEALMESMIADRIHYVMLMGERDGY